MLILQNVLKMKISLLKIVEISERSCFAKDFGNFCFRKNNVDPPVANIFRKNFLLSGKCFFWGGAWNGRGLKFGNTPPANRKPVCTALTVNNDGSIIANKFYCP
jgi:hypothetical protein